MKAWGGGVAGFLDDNAQPLANKAIRRRPAMARAGGNRASVIMLERNAIENTPTSDRFPGRCPDLKYRKKRRPWRNRFFRSFQIRERRWRACAGVWRCDPTSLLEERFILRLDLFHLFFASSHESRVCRTREGFNKGMQRTPGASGLLTQRMRAAGDGNEIDRSVGKTSLKRGTQLERTLEHLLSGQAPFKAPFSLRRNRVPSDARGEILLRLSHYSVRL
jgi:hypothetical protein